MKNKQKQAKKQKTEIKKTEIKLEDTLETIDDKSSQYYLKKAEDSARCGNYYDAVIYAKYAGCEDLAKRYLDELRKYNPIIAGIMSLHID